MSMCAASFVYLDNFVSRDEVVWCATFQELLEPLGFFFAKVSTPTTKEEIISKKVKRYTRDKIQHFLLSGNIMLMRT